MADRVVSSHGSSNPRNLSFGRFSRLLKEAGIAMANKKNKVKFGFQNVYWAKINEWGEDTDGNKTVPAYGPSKHLPGLYRCLSMQMASPRVFLRITGSTTSSTTMQDIQVTLKLPSSPQNLRLIFWNSLIHSLFMRSFLS